MPLPLHIGIALAFKVVTECKVSGVKECRHLTFIETRNSQALEQAKLNPMSIFLLSQLCWLSMV